MVDGGQEAAANAAASSLPSDEVLRSHAADLLKSQDLTQMSMKAMRSLLEERCGLPEGGLGAVKAKVKDIVTAEIVKLQGHSDAGQPGGSSTGGAQEPAAKKQKTELGETKRRQSVLFTRSQFMEKAKPFTVKLGEAKASVPAREFSTGSCGFFLNQKVPFEIDGERVMLQCTVNCTVIGSKEWKQK